jgi:hypothetical protein
MNSIALIIFVGVVDIVNGDIVMAEIDLVDDVVMLPTASFPCEIKEGDSFYLVRREDVTEIVCGEPPTTSDP